MNYIIRQERKEDYKETEHMVMRAFWNIHGPGCSEHLLTRIIRDSKDYLPEFSRVAELDGKIVGAIYYTKAKIVDQDATYEIVTFGPLAVEPTLQNSGVGRLLMEETFKLVKEAGYPGIVICGESRYYPKYGFKTCDQYGITDAAGNNFDALMCYPLDAEKFSLVHGKLYESESFEACEDESAIKEINKEFPEYPKVKIKEGFLQIYGGRFGVIETITGNECRIKFWELSIPAALDGHETAKAGDIVIFHWKAEGLSEITSVYSAKKVIIK